MNPNQLFKDLKAGKRKSLYLVHGEESYYVDQIVDFFETQMLNEAEAAFNLTVIYGRDLEESSLIDACMRLPMMSAFQLIIVKEAQMAKLGELTEKYLEKAVPSTILVLAHKHGYLDKRKRLYKLLEKNGAIIPCDKLSEKVLPNWIENYIGDKKLKISAKAVDLLCDYVGANLTQLINEIDKIILHKKEGQEISDEDIMMFVGISKEYNSYELQDAILLKNHAGAAKITARMMNGAELSDLIPFIALLNSSFTKIFTLHALRGQDESQIMSKLGFRSSWQYDRLKASLKHYNLADTEKAIGLLEEFDLKTKGHLRGHASVGDLIKEMVWRIMI